MQLVLGDTLALVDAQSELLKEPIQDYWLVEKQKKDAARYQMLLTTPLGGGSSENVFNKLIEVQARIKNEGNKLTQIGPDAPEVRELVDVILSCFEPDVKPVDPCIALASLGLFVDDAQDLALTKIDEWIMCTTSSSVERFEAVILKGFIQYCFRRDYEAITTLQKEMEMYRGDQATTDAMLMIKAYNMLVYLYADMSNTTIGKQLDASTMVEKYTWER